MAGERVEPTQHDDIDEAAKTAFQLATLAGANHILEMLAGDVPASTTLEAIARLAARLCPNATCAILTVADDRFRYAVAPSLPDGDGAPLPLDGAPIDPRWSQPVGTTDLASDPEWSDFRPWAERHGLRAGFFSPVLDRYGALVALFAVYFREPRELDWFERHMTERLTHLVDVALSHERAFARLKLSEKRLRVLLRTTSEALWVSAPDGMLIADPDVTWGNLTGQSLTEQAGRGWLEAVHPDDRERAWQRWKQSFENLTPYEQTYRVRRIDGVWAVVVARGRPLLGPDGRPQEWIGSATDITKEHRAQARLRFLADAGAMLDAAPSYADALREIAHRAADKLANYCAILVEVPTRTTRLTLSASVPDLPWAQPEQLRRLDQLTRSFLNISAPITMAVSGFENSKLSPEQAELVRELEISHLIAVPMRGADANFGVVAFADRHGSGYYLEADDVTLAEELSRRFVAAIDRAHTVRDLEAAIQARDDFLSVASHELKTPLTPLQLQIQAIERRPQGELPAWLIPRLRVIRSQVERFARLVEQLLDISRIAEGRVQLELSYVDLDQVVRDVVARFESAGEISRSGSTVELRGEPNLVGLWDRLRLEQVVTNLLSNALKYGERKPIGVRWHRDGDNAVLEVRDLGIGIAAEDQDRIFTRFERAVSVRHYGGFGLGLFVVRQLVDAMGGKVSVVSTPGQGATFKVVLPINAPSEPESSG